VALSVVPLKSTSPRGSLSHEGGDDDSVDGFVEGRHRDLLNLAGGDTEDGSDDGAEFGVGGEIGVLDIDVADDSSNGDSDNDGSDDEVAGDAMDGGWGGRRRTWYGGDTHEYEIMEDDERESALRDEEEEARRLQANALSAINPDDYVDSDVEGGTEDADGVADANIDHQRAEDYGDSGDPAPELPSLVQDLKECMHAISVCDPTRSSLTKFAKLRYHVMCSYATNIAFYLSLRTDPDATATDIRSHAVMREIVRLRSLSQTCAVLLKEGARGDATTEASDLPPPSMNETVEGTNAIKTEALGIALVATDVEFDLPKAKKKRARRHKRKRSVSDPLDHDNDEQFVRDVLGAADASMKVPGNSSIEDASKRRKLNRIVGALERERQSREVRRIAPADMDVTRLQSTEPKQLQQNADDGYGLEPSSSDTAGLCGEEENKNKRGDVNESDDEEFMLQMMAKKEQKDAKVAKKKESNAPHVYSFDDRIKDKDLRRRANSQVVNNRGLMRYRPKERKTPRTKNREAFHKAVKKRKSVVRDPVTCKPTSYGGEASGINMRARKGSRLADV
jgi:Sas10 C-terminal domain/Sas10/Utp3/C1D family